MSDCVPGMRVGVYHYGENRQPYLIGYGVYKGNEMPDIVDDESGDDSWTDLFASLGGSPVLVLDDGRELFGFECFWGPEEKIRQIFPGPVA